MNFVSLRHKKLFFLRYYLPHFRVFRSLLTGFLANSKLRLRYSKLMNSTNNNFVESPK